MNTFPLQQRHLAHLRQLLALLVARIEQTCGGTTEPQQRRELERTCTFAHDLLDKISLAEQAVSGHGDLEEVLNKLDERYRQGQERIEALHDRLEAIETPKKPDPHEHPPSSGSTIGDAVRDSFLNMGGGSTTDR